MCKHRDAEFFGSPRAVKEMLRVLLGSSCVSAQKVLYVYEDYLISYVM